VTPFRVSVALYAVAVTVAALVLPDRVPLHFGADLTADRTGSRAELVLGQAVLGVIVVAVFAGGAALARRASLEWVNVPHPEYWKSAENEPELRRRMRADLLHLGTVSMLVFAADSVLVTAAVVAGEDRLPIAAVVLLIAYVGYVLGCCAWLATRRYRPPHVTERSGVA
jgi:uncharacterized membrane protein